MSSSSSRYCVHGVREAIDILQQSSVARRETMQLESNEKVNDLDFNKMMTTSLELWVDLEERSIEQEGQWWLNRFVTVLSENKHLVKLWFYRGKFHHPNDSIERLLGEVLPSHQSLTCITFSWCYLQTAYIELLTGALIAANSNIKDQQHRGGCMHTLDLYQTKLDYEGVVAIANLIQANVPRIEKVVLQACGITSYGCQVILEALNQNNHLRALELHGNHISRLAAQEKQSVLGKSKLLNLNLFDNSLDVEAIHTLVEMLKTNEYLEQLRVSLSESQAELFNEPLTKFNSTLRVFRTNSNFAYSIEPSQHQQRIDRLLLLNEPARNAHEHLRDLGYQLPFSSFWPLALERVSSKVSLLYQCLRQGNRDLFPDTSVIKPPAIAQTTVLSCKEWD